METHRYIEETKDDITEKVHGKLSNDLMQFVNNVTNSNAALQENLKSMVEKTVNEWSIKLKYTWRLFWAIIGLFALLTIYLLVTHETRDRHVRMINNLIENNSTLIDETQTLIKDNHTLINETQTLIEDNHTLIEEHNNQ